MQKFLESCEPRGISVDVCHIVNQLIPWIGHFAEHVFKIILRYLTNGNRSRTSRQDNMLAVITSCLMKAFSEKKNIILWIWNLKSIGQFARLNIKILYTPRILSTLAHWNLCTSGEFAYPFISDSA